MARVTPGAIEPTGQISGGMPLRRSPPDGIASGLRGAYEDGRIAPGPTDAKTRSRFLPFFFEICIIGSAFSMAQGLITLRGARVGMERVGHTATTIATALLKSTQIVDPQKAKDPMIGQSEYVNHQKLLQRRVFKCLALLTAYPVCLLHQGLDNKRCVDIDRRCEEAALRLTEIHPITPQDLSQSSSQLSETSQSPMEKNVDIERTRFFEMFSLEMEMEFRTSCTKNDSPSLAAQRAITKIRMTLENLVDEGQLDSFRSPIIRENIDVMAISGRECLVYSYTDAVPRAFLWVLKIIAKVMLLAVPLFINVDWKSLAVSKRLYLCLLIGAVGASGLTILDEIDCMWKAFKKGMNTYAWSLGIAREIDELLNEPNDIIRMHWYNGVPNSSIREHSYNIGYDEVHRQVGRMESPYNECSPQVSQMNSPYEEVSTMLSFGKAKPADF
ncbi:hypothetical protein FVEN_g7392 [Fusarium venenatum]|nr:hypothetical protein FVEN_g7392 [Fusarium venenatum]